MWFRFSAPSEPLYVCIPSLGCMFPSWQNMLALKHRQHRHWQQLRWGLASLAQQWGFLGKKLEGALQAKEAQPPRHAWSSLSNLTIRDATFKSTAGTKVHFNQYMKMRSQVIVPSLQVIFSSRAEIFKLECFVQNYSCYGVLCKSIGQYWSLYNALQCIRQV